MSENTQPHASPYQQPPQPLSPSDEKLWATIIHLGGIILHFLPALIGYLMLKERGPFVREHSRTALNFQLTVLLANLVGIVTSWIIIGVFILAVVAVLNIIFCIIAAVAAQRGERYVYPLAIPFISA